MSIIVYCLAYVVYQVIASFYILQPLLDIIIIIFLDIAFQLLVVKVFLHICNMKVMFRLVSLIFDSI